MDNQTAITLKPKLGYWVSKYFVIIVVASLLPFSAIYWDLEMPVHYALMVLFLVIWIMLCYTYIDTLFATKWIITKDELIFRHGIISRDVDCENSASGTDIKFDLQFTATAPVVP